MALPVAPRLPVLCSDRPPPTAIAPRPVPDAAQLQHDQQQVVLAQPERPYDGMMGDHARYATKHDGRHKDGRRLPKEDESPMATTKLTDTERRVLEVLRDSDPDGDSQFNEFFAGFGDLTFTPTLAKTLRDLKRRNLTAGEGRGKWATWWITDDGRAALAG